MTESLKARKMASLRYSGPSLHGNLSKDPKSSIERTITILGKRIQVQHLTLAGITVALGIGSYFLGEQEHESDAQGSH